MQIRFIFDTEFGQFSDALNLPDDHSLTDEQLETMKQERLANWIAVVNPTVIATDTPVIEEI